MQIEILSPAKIMMRPLDTYSVFIPTSVGIINILENHADLITDIEKGRILIKTKDQGELYYDVKKNGACRVLNNLITIILP